MTPAARTVDEYLAALPDDQRAVLEHVRATIKATVPGAVEAISYGLCGYKFKGRPLIYFGAAKNHCAIYGGVVADTDKESLKDYDTSKGTIRFSSEKPLPAALITKFLNTRMAEIEAGEEAYKKEAK